MTCAKARVRVTLTHPDGRSWTGENRCRNPQAVCPRAPGEDYTKCRTICDQVGHAELDALALAGDGARGSTASIEGHTYYCMECQHALFAAGVVALRAPGTHGVPVVEAPKLAVWFGPMPESNGKANWTAILHRGDLAQGHTIERSEHHDRVRYEADRVRWLIGELPEEPDLLSYDGDMLSPPGYVHPCGVMASAPEHVCGLAGYNGMIDPPCPACEANRNAGVKEGGDAQG